MTDLSKERRETWRRQAAQVLALAKADGDAGHDGFMVGAKDVLALLAALDEAELEQLKIKAAMSIGQAAAVLMEREAILIEIVSRFSGTTAEEIKAAIRARGSNG